MKPNILSCHNPSKKNLQKKMPTQKFLKNVQRCHAFGRLPGFTPRSIGLSRKVTMRSGDTLPRFLAIKPQNLRNKVGYPQVLNTYIWEYWLKQIWIIRWSPCSNGFSLKSVMASWKMIGFILPKCATPNHRSGNFSPPHLGPGFQRSDVRIQGNLLVTKDVFFPHTQIWF